MPPHRFRCTNRSCGAVWLQPHYCAACGGDFLVALPESVRNQPTAWQPRQRRGLRSAQSVVEQSKRAQRVSWGLDGLSLPLKTSVTLEGPPGGGKSTAATYVALALAAQGIEVVYVAVEEPDGATLTERFQRCRRAVGLPSLPRTLRLSDAISPHEVDEDLEAFQRGVVVLDSLTELRASDEWLAAQLVRPGLGWVLVQHWTTGKAPRGGLEPAYTVDVRGVVKDFGLRLIKNRWGPCVEIDLREPLSLNPEPDRQVVTFPGGDR